MDFLSNAWDKLFEEDRDAAVQAALKANALRPGPTREAQSTLREHSGSRGAIDAVTQPLQYAPGPIGLAANAARATPYLTGEKSFAEQGLPGVADTVSNLTQAVLQSKLGPVGAAVRGAKGLADSATDSSQARAKALRGSVEDAPFPRIYDDPRSLVANAKVAPEDPLMKQLFGVDRRDLFDIAQQGTRQGNIVERPFTAPPGAKGSAAARELMTPENAQRLQDIIGEARNRPELFQGMASWYTMDPLYQHFERLYGPERAVEEYNRFNTLTGMSSPGSEVLTELNRGTAARMMADKGQFDKFVKYGGMAENERGRGYPKELAAVIGHPYHSTAQAQPMAKYLESGNVDMKSAKVPSYIAASGVPETGFQTQWPVGDAHWSRLVGLPETRGAQTSQVRNASATVPEMVSLAPWWKSEVAAKSGLESVPAQAVVWGAGSNATGVTSPIGAPKLELLAQQIGETAKRLGVSPETARDLVITGKAHAGFIDPELAAKLGLGASAATAAAYGANDASQ